MIVQCDACQTKFRIDDSKVTEKGIKVKCTKCQNTFVVKPQVAAAPAPPPPEYPKESPKESQFDISFGSETETEEPQPPKEKEMTEDEKLAAEWAKSISFEEEKPAEKEEPQKSDIAGIEASEAAMQMPSLGELSSFSFEEEEKKQPDADIFAEPAAGEKSIFEPDILPPPVKEEPVFEFPSEKAVEPQTFEQVFEQAIESSAELPPLSSIQHEEIHEEIPEKPHEEPHEKAEEASSAVPQEIKHARSKLIPILAVLVIIVGFALFYLSGGVSSIFKMSNKKPSVSTGKFDIVELKGYYTENTSIGKLFVIEGKITSTFDKSKDIMGIKGSIFNSKGETMEENMASPGAIISMDDLKTISKEELENRFKNKKKTSLPAKGSMPFMIVFSDLSTDPQEYGVELVQ
ncbi:MAG: zinc-ribbon domain-containing protein [Deltaproteobacteria bacterium]|nr:zinc-ribbon domain-containing protein [Deltaproteobacteria bacterium]